MKRIYMLSLFALVLLLAPTGIIRAEMVTSLDEGTSFKIKTTAINKIVDTTTTRFVFEPSEIKNSQNIAHWKVRLTCDDKLDIRVNDLDQNVCNKVVRVERGGGDVFSMLYANGTSETAAFSFKVKAYDKNGNWLHSEKQSFQWR